MKKTKTTILQLAMSCLLAFVFMLGIFMPLTPFFAVAEETEKVKYGILPSSYNDEPSETLTKYNIDTNQKSGFTPFDFEEQERMPGMAFMFETADEKNQINNQYVLLDEVTNVQEGKDYSLNLWIFFDKIYLHNLEITLELENSCTIKWLFLASDLYTYLSGTGMLEVSGLPYGYVNFDLPFSQAIIEGELYESNKLVSPSKMYVNFSSETTLIEDFSALRFYDINITEATDNQAISITKQNYRFYSLDFFPSNLVSAVCVGDSLTLPSKQNAINYAWNGTSDLYALSNRDNPTVVWKVLVKTPAAEDNLVYKSFGDKIDFNMEGTYQIYYQCYDTSISNDKYIISESISISVNKLNAINFGTSIKKLEVGKTYVLNISASSLFKEVSDFTFETSSQDFVYEYRGDGVVEITALKEGDFSLTAKVSANREIDTTTKEYSSTISIEAINMEKDDNVVLKVALWVVLGIFGIVLIIFTIKTLVKARKYDVK